MIKIYDVQLLISEKDKIEFKKENTNTHKNFVLRAQIHYILFPEHNNWCQYDFNLG